MEQKQKAICLVQLIKGKMKRKRTKRGIGGKTTK